MVGRKIATQSKESKITQEYLLQRRSDVKSTKYIKKRKRVRPKAMRLGKLAARLHGKRSKT